MKRGRNQRRRQGGGGGGMNPNRALDSNGPDVRIRGTANQIYEKYQALARDAASSGDRVKAENYLQHAEHYFRVIRSMQPAQPPPGVEQPSEGEFDGEQPSIGDYPERRSAYGDAEDQGERRSETEADHSGRGDGERHPASEGRSEQRYEQRPDKRPEQRQESRSEQRAGFAQNDGEAPREDRESRDAADDNDRRNRRRHRPRRPDRDDRRFGGEERDATSSPEPSDADEVPA